MDSSWRERYAKAHEKDFAQRHPVAYADRLYIKPKYPKVGTANGLTQMIENYINWQGYRCTRINVAGRLIEGQEKLPTGGYIGNKKFMRSTTRRGTADLSSTIKGKSVMWEVKIAKDKPSEHQLKEQAKERKAGGEYFFVHDPNEFFMYYDEIINSTLF